MSWADRSLPPERDDDPPPTPTAPIEQLLAERRSLIAQVRRGVHSQRQRRIIKRIAAITTAILATRGPDHDDQR